MAKDGVFRSLYMPVEEKLIPLLDRVATFTYLMVDIRESRRMQAQAGDLRIYVDVRRNAASVISRTFLTRIIPIYPYI